MTGLAFKATSFKNLIIHKNNFINQKEAPTTLKTRGSIEAEYGSGLYVEDNTWTTEKGIARPDLLYDPNTTEEVSCKDNRLTD
jgi:nitrous oxidase accessory protein NosD